MHRNLYSECLRVHLRQSRDDVEDGLLMRVGLQEMEMGFAGRRGFETETLMSPHCQQRWACSFRGGCKLCRCDANSCKSANTCTFHKRQVDLGSELLFLHACCCRGALRVKQPGRFYCLVASAMPLNLTLLPIPFSPLNYHLPAFTDIQYVVQISPTLSICFKHAPNYIIPHPSGPICASLSNTRNQASLTSSCFDNIST